MDCKSSTGVSTSRPTLGWKAGEHVRSKQGQDWGVSGIQGAGRTLDSHLHFPDKDTEMQQDEGS